MRTTLNTLFSQAQSNINRISSDLAKINSQISSGRQMSKLSDDPTNLVSALGMRTTVAEIAQYQDNLNHGGAMITAAENALRQIKDQVMEAKTIAISAQTPVVAPNRHLIAPQVANLLDQAVTLANTQIAGKYIFGGYRTSGYTETEPAPFIHDLIDGYRLNGTTPTTIDLLNQGGTVEGGVNLLAGDLQFSTPTSPPSVPVGPVVLPAETNGITMSGAANLRDAINLTTGTSGVTASLTTQIAGTTPITDTTVSGPLNVSFDINGSPVIYTADGTAAEVAQQTITAVNALSGTTGVEAVMGTGDNGGAAGTLLFRNVQEGDESAINVTTPLPAAAPGVLGFTTAISAANANADNTGAVSLSSSQAFTFEPTTDAILQIAGFADSTIAPTTLDADGNPTEYGIHANGSLGANDLKINGIWVPAAQDDGISSVEPDLSAAAKATAINSISDQTGVTAEITPAIVTASAPVTLGVGSLGPGDVIINGIDIFAVATGPIATSQNIDSTIIETINASQASTGVYASRDSSGTLVLKAIDGRNIQVETSANGEDITHLNGAPPATAANQVSFGRLELLSNRTFMLESPVFSTDSNVYEAGLIALGLDGGTVVTGEPTDVAGDGKLSALTIADLEGNVRYAGDREEVLEIKVGKVEKITISQNGQVALKNTQVFSALQDLEDALLGKNFTEVTSLMYVTDRFATFASSATGLPNDPDLPEPIVNGSFTVNVVDHDHVPPETFDAVIPVDINVDTPDSIAAKLDGIPGINASWNIDGYLEVTSSDPDRYTFSTSGDSSNFTEAVCINNEDMQVHAINKSIGDLDLVMEELTTHISDFGARGNRVDVQSQIFTNLNLAVQENLSDQQDTDILKAIMDLKAAENAYEAALASAARTMQMSLLDFL